MKLYSFCVLGVMGITLGCFDKNKDVVIDTSCDHKEVRIPDKWKSDCIDSSTGFLLKGIDEKTRRACVNIAFNNRDLKRKHCIGDVK